MNRSECTKRQGGEGLFAIRMKVARVLVVAAIACLVTLLMAAGSGDGGTMRESMESRRIGKAWCDAWNAHDPRAFANAFTHDVYYEDVAAGVASRGTGEFAAYAQAEWAIFPDLSFQCVSTIVKDGHGSIEWIGTGTEVGLFGTHKRATVRGASVIDVRGGKISRSIDYYDFATILRQIGVLP